MQAWFQDHVDHSLNLVTWWGWLSNPTLPDKKGALSHCDVLCLSDPWFPLDKICALQDCWEPRHSHEEPDLGSSARGL